MQHPAGSDRIIPKLDIRTKKDTLPTSYTVQFFRTPAGNEPARDWLRNRSPADRRAIGEDLKVVQCRWPLGMPLVRKMEPRLWELRSKIPEGCARLFFTIWSSHVVVLHTFVKQSEKTPDHELKTAQRRLREFERNRP
jgi:phage-related protein